MKPDKLYCIRNNREKDEENNEPFYWSNDWGWITENFTVFSEEERFSLNLPINGIWEVY